MLIERAAEIVLLVKTGCFSGDRALAAGGECRIHLADDMSTVLRVVDTVAQGIQVRSGADSQQDLRLATKTGATLQTQRLLQGEIREPTTAQAWRDGEGGTHERRRRHGPSVCLPVVGVGLPESRSATRTRRTNGASRRVRCFVARARAVSSGGDGIVERWRTHR